MRLTDCPACGAGRLNCVETTPLKRSISRKRRCTKCGYTANTYERFGKPTTHRILKNAEA